MIRIAYRMLGSYAEAEDMVQDAWLRWQRTDQANVHHAEAFLVRTLSRLCLDHLKSAAKRRETYPGMWLPEPVADAPVSADENTEDLTMALMVALDRLSPLERAAFLLHDIFDVSFDEVAKAIGRDAAACRQLASRARAHVRAAKPRYPVSEDKARTIADAFFQASRNGNMDELRSMLSQDAIMYSDGGGIRNAALNPIFGSEKIMRFYEGIARKSGGGVPEVHHYARFDGLPGHMSVEADGLPQVAALDIEDGLIRAIYLIRNPQKLTHLRVE